MLESGRKRYFSPSDWSNIMGAAAGQPWDRIREQPIVTLSLHLIGLTSCEQLHAGQHWDRIREQPIVTISLPSDWSNLMGAAAGQHWDRIREQPIVTISLPSDWSNLM
jgi:hypothetical protein